MRSFPVGWSTMLAKLGLTRQKRRNAVRNQCRTSLRLEQLEDRRMLAPVTVGNNLDIVNGNVSSIAALIATPGADGISLREAITAANADSTGDTITFATGLNGGEILLNRANGALNITRTLTIDASALQDGITINGNDPTPSRTGTGIRIFNITDSSGGSAPSLTTLIGLTLTGADAQFDGGAIRSESRLVILDCIIAENAADRGGGIFVEVAGGGAVAREVLRIESSIVDDNAAAIGGGIAIVAGATGAVSDTIYISGTTITDNITSSNGGGLFADLNGADLTIAESTIERNGASNGGGIYANLNGNGSRTASLTILASVLEENDASHGGGILAEINGASLLRVEDTTFHDNEVNGNGGGVKATLYNASRLEVFGALFVQNDGDHGGGLHADLSAQSRVNIENSTFDGNEANGGHGGGVYVRPDGDSIVEVAHSIFVQNDAGGSGGGFFSEAFNGSSLVLRGLTVEDNDAAQGGGIFADIHTATMEIDQSSITLNEASNSGGGVQLTVRTDGSAFITQSVIVDNVAVNAPGGGGGVFGKIEQNAELTIADSTIARNIAQDGGGVEVDMPGFNHNQANGSRFTLERSLVEGNRAVNRGGGLLTATGSGGQVDIVDSVITGNDAGLTLANTSNHPLSVLANAGGGIYSYLFSDVDPAVLTISGTEISQNTAGQHGGGLAVFSKREHLEAAISRASIYNTTISGNTAGHTTVANDPGTGGGVHLTIWNAVDDEGEEALDTRFQNTTITDNVADQGGGVYSLVPQHALRRTDTRLTNSIIWANRKHAGTASNLHGSFNIVETVFNIVGPAGTGNNTYSHTSHAVQALNSASNFNQDPLLSLLQNHGGPTRTHVPLTGSYAIDRGDSNKAEIPFTSTLLSTDQRGTGFARRRNVPGVNDPGDVVDMGAYEVGAPKVIDVIISTSQESGRSQSYAELLEDAASDSGIQLRTVLFGHPDIIEIRFDQPVVVAQNSLSLRALSKVVASPTVKTNGFTSPSASNDYTARWELNSAFDVAQYLITVSATVTGVAGMALDGEWVNPRIWMHSATMTFGSNPGRSNFPSGDGAAGGDFSFVFTFALGTDNAVGNDELTRLLDGWGKFVTGPENGDFNEDGYVGNLDLTILLDSWGLNLNLLRVADFDGDNHVTTVDRDLVLGDVNHDGFINSADTALANHQLGLKYLYVA
jgi:hypothetical protein